MWEFKSGKRITDNTHKRQDFRHYYLTVSGIVEKSGEGHKKTPATKGRQESSTNPCLQSVSFLRTWSFFRFIPARIDIKYICMYVFKFISLQPAPDYCSVVVAWWTFFLYACWRDFVAASFSLQLTTVSWWWWQWCWQRQRQNGQ